MKNTRLFIMLGVFIFLTGVIILCSTVFTLNTVEIGWLSTTKVLSEKTDTEIIDSGEFKFGESVFLLKKDKYKQKLEKNNPYIKVLGLELKFPNQLKVTVSEREELYVIKVTNENSSSGFSYVYLDYDLKVLKITDTPVPANQQNPAIVSIDGLDYSVNDFEVGTLTNMPIGDILKSIGYMLTSTGYTNTLYKALIKSIDIKYNINTTVNIATTYGLNLKLLKAEQKTSQKMLKALSVYEYYHNSHPEINAGDITVFEQNGDVVATGPKVD